MILFLAFRNLFRNLRRTIAILLTVALGSGALFSFDGFINGVLKQYRDNTIHAHYGFGQINTKGYRGTVYEEPWKHWITNWDQLKNSLLKLEEVEQVFPRVGFSALLSHGNVTISGQGQGIEAKEEAQFFHSLNVEEGKPLSDQKKGILLGEGLAKALDVHPGDSVTVLVTATDQSINRSELTVCGIFHTGSLDFDSRMFRIQLGEAQSLLKTSDIELVSLGLRNLKDWDVVAQEIQNTFPELEATPFAVLDEVYYQHSVDWLNAQFHVVQIIILSIVLLGIFNTISASILERKQEVGNLRANGESIFSIMRLIVTEGTLLGVIGGALGLFLSFSLLKLCLDQGIKMPPGPGLTRDFFVTFSFEWSMVYFTLIQSILAAIVASILAGLKVARMPIAKALKSH